MRIVLICHFMNYPNLRSYSFGRSLAQMGHDVTHVSVSHHARLRSRTEVRNGMKLVETPDLLWGRARSGWDPWNVTSRLKHFSSWTNGQIDLVHGFECRPVTIFPILTLKKRMNNLIFISDWNDWWGRGGLIKEQRPLWYRLLFGSIETYFEEAFRKKADGVTVISSALAERALRLGVDYHRICRIPGGVDTDFFKSLPMKTARKELGVPTNIRLAVFSAARVQFDIDLVLRSFARVSKVIPSARLMLTGEKSPLAQRFAEKNGLEDKIFQCGKVPFEDFPKYLSCADIFLVPFRQKIANVGRWPNKVGEYMSVGRPIVSNPVGDVKELFEREKVGLLATEDPDDFAEKIIHLFENSKLCEELGNNGRRVAKEKFSWPILTKRLEDFYRRFF